MRRFKRHTRVFKIPVQLSQTRFLATSPNLYWLSVSLDTHFEPGCLKLVKIADSDCVKNVSKQMAIFLFEDVPLAEFMYFVFTRMPGESYRRRLGSLFLCLCGVFWTLINSLCWLFLCFERIFITCPLDLFILSQTHHPLARVLDHYLAFRSSVSTPDATLCPLWGKLSPEKGGQH